MSTTLSISELSNDLNIISIPMEEPHLVSFKHNFEHCTLLIAKRLELLMLLRSLTETKAAFNTHALSTFSCYSV